MATAAFCAGCGAALVGEGRFCAACGAPVVALAPETAPAPSIPAIPTEVEHYEYANTRARDLDIVAMHAQGWIVERTAPHGSGWRVSYRRAAAGQPTPVDVRTVTREYDNAGLRDADIVRMAEYDWGVQGVQTIAGSYNGDKGCLLAIIFLPLALIAGNKPDRYVVTYVAQRATGQMLLPAPLAVAA